MQWTAAGGCNAIFGSSDEKRSSRLGDLCAEGYHLAHKGITWRSMQERRAPSANMEASSCDAGSTSHEPKQTRSNRHRPRALAAPWEGESVQQQAPAGKSARLAVLVQCVV